MQFKCLIVSALVLSFFVAFPCFSAENPQLYSEDTAIDVKSGLGRDHAHLEADQSKQTQGFVKKYFFNEDGSISLEKINALLEILRLEKENLKKDLYESTVLEQVEVDVSSQSKARKSAQKMIRGSQRTIDVYTNYLIPTIERLRNLVQGEMHLDKWAGLIDDFIRAYHVFRSPNSNVTMWPGNNSQLNVFKGVLVPKKIKKTDPKKDEAINLIVEEENLALIRQQLGYPINVGHYLTKQEITALKNSQYDLSLVNPGISALWEKRSEADIQEFKSRDTTGTFPSENSILIFKEVMLTGGGSPKIAVKEKGTGRTFKVKWGVEAHVDNALGNISYLLGFNIDPMLYKKELKIHLGKRNYTQFISLLQAKYGQAEANHTVLGRGGVPGDEWVILKDLMIEARPEDDSIKTTPFDPTAIDFNERREFNGKLLFNAYVNLIDAKIANMKMLLAKSSRAQDDPTGPDTRPRILLRMKDLGYALGPSFNFNRFKQIFTVGVRYLPDSFEEKGIVKLNKKKDTVIISWNDFYRLKGLYDSVTYFDLKWMARKIAALSGDDIEWSLIKAGMPIGVAKLYRSKLISRRNEIIQTFELNDDPNFHYPEETPDLPGLNYQGDEPDGVPEVKDGKISRSHFTGKQVYLKTKSTVLYNIITFTGNFVELLINTLSLSPGKDFPIAGQLALNSSLISPEIAGAGNMAELTQTFDSNVAGTPLTFQLGVGVSANLSRRVLITPDLHTDRDTKARPYYVRDTLIISVGLGSPLLKKILPMLPVSLNGKIKVLEAVYEYDHYSEAYLSGFKTSPIPFLKSLIRPIEQAVTSLDRMEVIRRSISFGIEAGASSSLFDYSPFVLSRTTFGAGKIRMDDRSYFRDQYGHLHAFTQGTNKSFSGFDFTIGQISNPVIFRLPALGFQNNHLSYTTVQKDMVAFPDQGEHSSEFPIEDNDGRLREDLKKINSGQTESGDLDHFKQNFSVKGKGEISFQDRIRFLNGYCKEKRRAVTKIDYPDGHQKHLLLHSTRRDKYLGIASNRSIIPYRDLAVKKAQRVYINFELDEYDHSSSVIILRVLDFFRNGNTKDVLNLIERLNQRFSASPETPIYRDFELPSTDEVDSYRKVYGVTRVYISTMDLLDKIVSLDSDIFKGKLNEFFSDHEERRTGNKIADLNFFDRFIKKHKIKKDVDSMMTYFEALKKEARQLTRNYKKISALIDKFIYHQRIHEYGTDLLLQIVGQDSLFLAGDIGGIFPSFSVANDLQERQRRRFAAKHWGKLNVVAPVQFHNRYERVLYSSDLVPIHIPQDTMFGRVTNGQPEELKDIE